MALRGEGLQQISLNLHEMTFCERPRRPETPLFAPIRAETGSRAAFSSREFPILHSQTVISCKKRRTSYAEGWQLPAWRGGLSIERWFAGSGNQQRNESRSSNLLVTIEDDTGRW